MKKTTEQCRDQFLKHAKQVVLDVLGRREMWRSLCPARFEPDDKPKVLQHMAALDQNIESECKAMAAAEDESPRPVGVKALLGAAEVPTHLRLAVVVLVMVRLSVDLTYELASVADVIALAGYSEPVRSLAVRDAFRDDGGELYPFVHLERRTTVDVSKVVLKEEAFARAMGREPSSEAKALAYFHFAVRTRSMR